MYRWLKLSSLFHVKICKIPNTKPVVKLERNHLHKNYPIMKSVTGEQNTREKREELEKFDDEIDLG